MIVILLAALFGAAQEVFVVTEGATSNHSVEKHPGSTYAWGMFVDFSPDINAPPGKYEFVGPADSEKIQIRWLNPGIYYLKVSETDLKGCENIKVLPVNVVSNNRTIAFLLNNSNTVFRTVGNGFEIPLVITDNNGQPLANDYYPLEVEFRVNGKAYSQQISFNSQVLKINSDWLDKELKTNLNVIIEITRATDNRNVDIRPDKTMKTHVRTIQPLPQITLISPDINPEQGLPVTYTIKLQNGNPDSVVFHWSIEPQGGTSTNLSLIHGPSATILWDGEPGIYHLLAGYTYVNGNFGDTSKIQVQIAKPSAFVIDAGRDTIIGRCQTMKLQAKVEQQPGVTYTYLWKPGLNLDDPKKTNPVFTPGSTTNFIVTVTNSQGVSVSDTVNVAVSESKANAGEDVFMLPNTQAILDGSRSIGRNLRYRWTSPNGKIESGASTANPVVSSFGIYILEVLSESGCSAFDTVNVFRLAQAPVANDDYDTTRYRTETVVAVLGNDSDPQNGIYPGSLKIINAPFNGTAYINYNNYKIHYRPNEGFSGNEIFEYEICNNDKLCDRAKVFVMVTEYNFKIPDAFSPNGDGINDFFEIVGIDRYPGNSITIINRWGNRVYQAKNYGIDTNPVFWDGNANTGTNFLGNELPTGTYYYVLDLGNGEKPIAGSVYLDR